MTTANWYHPAEAIEWLRGYHKIPLHIPDEQINRYIENKRSKKMKYKMTENARTLAIHFLKY